MVNLTLQYREETGLASPRIPMVILRCLHNIVNRFSKMDLSYLLSIYITRQPLTLHRPIVIPAKAEIQEAISDLRIKLKQCDMEKEAIENFNHTQFLNNVKASDQNTDRFTDEKTGNTRFFEHLK